MLLPGRPQTAASLWVFLFFFSAYPNSPHAASTNEAGRIQGLWNEHITALEAKGVPVNLYREKTIRLDLMLAENDRESLGELMKFHSKIKSKLAELIAQHFLLQDETLLDRNILELAKAKKKSWDESLKQKITKANSYYEFTWPKIELALKQGEYVQAEQLILEMLWDYPSDEKSLRYLAQLYIFNHEWRLADIVYEVLQSLGHEDVEILNNRTLIAIQLSGPENGQQPLEKLEKRYPNEAAIIQNRAVLAEQLEDAEHKLILAGRWAQVDRKNPEALKHYGQKLLESKSWIFARDAFTRAIRLRPETSDLGAMWGLAQAEAGMGEYKKSIRLIYNIKEVSNPADFKNQLMGVKLPDGVVAEFLKESAR